MFVAFLALKRQVVLYVQLKEQKLTPLMVESFNRQEYRVHGCETALQGGRGII
jgi:hypothetical protein